MPYSFKTPLLLVITSLVTLAVLHFVNPLLPERFSLGTTTNDKVDNTEGALTISYEIPSREDVEKAASFEGYVPEEQLVEKPVDIPMPLNVVDQSYITAFNTLVNKGILIEEQLKQNVAPAMELVQKEAASANYIKLFERMGEARTQIEVLDGIIADFDKALVAYRASYTAKSLDTNVRRTSDGLSASALVFYTDAKNFSGLLAKTVNGTVPDQQLISEIEAANSKFTDAAKSFSVQIALVGESMKVGTQ